MAENDYASTPGGGIGPPPRSKSTSAAPLGDPSHMNGNGSVDRKFSMREMGPNGAPPGIHYTEDIKYKIKGAHGA